MNIAAWPAENMPVLGVGASLVDEPLGVADALRRDEDPLGVHSGKNVAKALPLLAD